MRFRRISILIIILLCICSSCIVAGSLPAMDERAAPWHDLVKKPSLEGPAGLKGDLPSNGASAKIVTSGPDDGLQARHDIRYQNVSGTRRGYAIPGARPWPVSKEPALYRSGTEIVEGTGTIRCIDPEGGIYLIITGDGDHYLPSNLQKIFAKEGTRVEFKAIKMPINLHTV